MRQVALFVDDAATARAALQPLMRAGGPGRILLIACTPALTRYAGRFVSGASRDQQRWRWAHELFADLQPIWAAAAHVTIETHVAHVPIEVMVQRMRVHYGTDLVALDARRARRERPCQVSVPTRTQALIRWLVPAFISSGVGIALALAE
jgi:hypothetical protein